MLRYGITAGVTISALLYDVLAQKTIDPVRKAALPGET
jgi:hypothetical protein